MKRPWILRTACLQVRRPLYHVHLMTALIVSELSTWFLHSNFCGKRSSSKNPYPSDFMVASLEWPSHFPAPPCGFMSHLFLSTVKVTSIFYSLNLPSCLPITSSVSQKFLDAHPGLCVSLTCTPPPPSICTFSLQSLREQGSLLSESRSYLAPGSLGPHLLNSLRQHRPP